MVQELTEDHRLWQQEMTWTPALDLDSLAPLWWEWAAQVVAWMLIVLLLGVSLGQLLL